MDDIIYNFVLDGRTIGSLLAEDKLLSEFDLGSTLEDAKYNVSELINSLNSIDHPLSSKYTDNDFLVSLENLGVLKQSLKEIPDKIIEDQPINELPEELLSPEELDDILDEVED